MGTAILVVGILVALVVLYIMVQNGLVAKRNQAKNAWSQIDVQLKRKLSLVPTLIDALKQEMGHEHQTLVKISEARASLGRANTPSEAAMADHRLNASLSTLFQVVSENYPQLQAHGSFVNFQEEYTSTENRVAYARQAYNDAVTSYHTAMETFPGTVVAGRMERMQLFEMVAEERTQADVAMRF